ncbi:MAG: FMN-binding negative transcriptional regulator [Ginsengibacter sp.]
MYKRPHFTETDSEKVFEFMQQNPFAIITCVNGDFPVATHIPLEIRMIENKIILTGHIMNETDHYKAFVKNENVLVIFNGPHCYVSASWYVKKNIASTWNYMTVHTKGKLKLTDNNETKKIIESITNQYEGNNSEASFNKMPHDYIESMSKAIVGFHIEIESIENVFKLSQNRDELTRKQIIENLENSNDYNAGQIAEEMKIRL